MVDHGFWNMTAQSEFGNITSVIVKHARDAFEGPGTIAAQWQTLNYTAAPDFVQARPGYEDFLEILRDSGCEIHSAQGGRRRTGFHPRAGCVGCLRPRNDPLQHGQPAADR